MSILITGGLGVIAARLIEALSEHGHHPIGFDLRTHPGSISGDIRDPERVHNALHNCTGIVHLAAVSRVHHGEADPDLCWQTNVSGTRNVLAAALASPWRPWVLLASSREVYGEPDALPANEDAPLRPVNHYGRSKLAAEALAWEARAKGLRVAVVRMSNVYGSPDDHPDRVIPAFARAAVADEPLQVRGENSIFDFIHIDDVLSGLLSIMQLLEQGEDTLPPLLLSSGRGTTLIEVAHLAQQAAGMRGRIMKLPPAAGHVTRFVGDSTRTAALLGWKLRVSLEEGIHRLVGAFERRQPGNQTTRHHALVRGQL